MDLKRVQVFQKTQGMDSTGATEYRLVETHPYIRLKSAEESYPLYIQDGRAWTEDDMALRDDEIPLWAVRMMHKLRPAALQASGWSRDLPALPEGDEQETTPKPKKRRRGERLRRPVVTPEVQYGDAESEL